ncbi:exonuclease SbcD [Runella defluvii]|uniref:Nuclease SbcCD subunit D n=1 Tax=Runella defluvii TaxID=370973 RepID=A0A7W6ET03_9BACT|nr:exonuclease subunit SbcD [Runella defluvii]MBB3841198.1 exonuclease SbcD [Runella defluvii]
MKILHTADWHLGKRLEQFSRLDEQKEVLNEICEIAEREAVDAVVIAGDLFDNFSPSSEAMELLYSTLHRLSNFGSRAVIAIAGNHDSPERIDAPDALAKVSGIIFVGFPNAQIRPFETKNGIKVTKTDVGFVELQLPALASPLRLILTPYANEIRLKTFLGVEKAEENLRQMLQQHWQQLADAHCDDRGVNMLVTHLYVMRQDDPTPPEEPDDERPILHIGGAQAIYTENFPAQIQYVALGHLHRYQTVSKQPCPIIYSSSPLAYSFAEANQTKYVVIIEAEAGTPVAYRQVALTSGKKLLRGRFEQVDEALAWLDENQDALVELTIVTDNFLESSDKKRLMEAHAGLMPIIPEIRTKTSATSSDTTRELLQQEGRGMEELFINYFKNSKEGKGQAPNESLLGVFKEILALDEDDNI